ncbi:MAG TPA: type III secretion system outer membrane ring subunit SctC [Ideonella sp.]|nr:type III secretion system outer membrane ring subunit SctC [Ideonella sp.]
MLLAGSVAAVPLPESGRLVTLEARDQPLDQFLQDVFAASDIPVVVNAPASGLVNGRFNGTATRVLRDVSRAYNLTSYYDGAALHVGPASDMLSRSYVLPAATAQQVVATVKQLQLSDARNTLRSTNDGALVAVGARRYLQQMDELVRQLRPQTAAPPVSAQPLMDYRVFYLRYAWAQDLSANFAGRQTVLPGVVSILRSLVGQGAQPGGGAALDRTSAQRLRGQGLANQAGASARMPTLGQDGAEPRGVEALVTALNQVAEGGSAQPAPAAQPTPESLSAPRIEADPRLNAVIVRDLPERLPRYAELIKSLDIEPQALEIEATIIDINTDRLQELGVNWRLNHGLSSLMFGNGTDSDLRLDGRQDPTPSYRGGALSAVLGDRWPFVARISALEAQGAAKVVSSPQVVTLSNVEAVFDSSSTFYVRVAGRDEVDLFNVTAGTSLRVTPHAFRDNDASRIKLMVQIEDGTLSSQTVDTLPVVRRSGINTQALIVEGESLLVGGMTRDSSSIGEDKIPLLGDLPVIGNLFKTRSAGRERVERLFLITPRLASARGTAAAAEKARAPLQPAAPAPALPGAAPLAPPPTTPPAEGPMKAAPP